MSKQIIVPDIGDFEKVEIIEILVKQGDFIKINDPLITLESDKSSVEVPSTEEGTIEKINVKVGDKVSKGDIILSINLQNNEAKPKLSTDTEKIIQEAELSLKKESLHKNQNNSVDLRVVVLREFNKEYLKLNFHTDFRSPKIVNLKKTIILHFFFMINHVININRI